MIHVIDFKDGKMVFGENEFLYQEVVDDFERAVFIKILTFNISQKKDSYLLKKLKEACAKGAKATLFTNIPKRYKSYVGLRYESIAKRNIDSYLSQLNPTEYHMRLNPYFTFKNHSKIIMTNNMVYIGSSNFSDESKDNYECGYISRNKKVIEEINNTVFYSFEKQSIPYYKYNFAIALSNLEDLIPICENAKQELFEATHSIYEDYGSNFQEVWYYDPYNSRLTVDFMRSFIESFKIYEDALLVVGMIINDYESEEEIPQKIEELDNILSEYKATYAEFYNDIECLFYDLNEVGSYNVSHEASQLLSDEYGMEAYDEQLEYYIGLCMQESFDTYEDLIREAKPKVEESLNKLEEMILSLKNIKLKLIECLEVSNDINNTSIK